MSEQNTKPTLVLASRSPRRAALLHEAGYRFAVVDPPYADPPPGEGEVGADPSAYTREQAAMKARSLAEQLPGAGELPGAHPGALPGAGVVLSADTVCVGTGGELVGKPADRDQAGAMLRRFVGAQHAVVTGVALLANGELHTLADSATVRWDAVGEDVIRAYLDSGDWRGKAGGYNLFDRQDAGWPITVRGDASTVVGLPMGRLAGVLERLGVRPHEVSPQAIAAGRA